MCHCQALILITDDCGNLLKNQSEKVITEPADASGVRALNGRDLRCSDNGRSRESGVGIALTEVDVSGPAAVLGARHHQNPQEAAIHSGAAKGDHKCWTVLLNGSVGIGERDADYVALVKGQHTRADRLRWPTPRTWQKDRRHRAGAPCER